jgi:hypothetical protein
LKTDARFPGRLKSFVRPGAAVLVCALLAACAPRPLRPADVFALTAGQVSSALAKYSSRWQHLTTAHLAVHYSPECWSEGRADSVAEQMETLFRRNLAILGDTTYSNTVDVFLVGPKSDVAAITGQAVTAAALLPDRGIALSNLRLATRPEILQHELMHVLSCYTWGIPQDFFAAEGVATAAAGSACYGYDFDAIAGYRLRQGKLPGLRAMADNVFRYDEATTHYSAASFVRFVERRYGPDGVRMLWHSGLARGAAALGTSLGRLEKEWHDTLSQTAPITDSDWRRLTTADTDSLQRASATHN